MPSRPSHILLAALLPLAAMYTLAAAPATAGGLRHPHFNDRGTLRWHDSLASARREAQRNGKLILIEFSREQCGNCRRLAERVLPDARLRTRLRRDVIGLASDCDAPEPAVRRMFREHMPNGRALPFVALLGPEGRWITGWSGPATVAEVAGQLALGEAHLRRMRTASRGRHAAVVVPVHRQVRRVSARTAPAPRAAHAVAGQAGAIEGGCVGGACKPPSFDEPAAISPLEALLVRRRPAPPCSALRGGHARAAETAPQAWSAPTEASAAAIGPHDFVEFPRPRTPASASGSPAAVRNRVKAQAAPNPKRALRKDAPAAVAHASAAPAKRRES